jgi:hydroxymethylbilane synthase|tara:strand:- start:1228 stop:2757 length:1530 start_codon:yes stop_codon:yes gene_type:complete
MIKIISRKSDLAVIQAEIVANALKQADKDISVSFIKKETEGDIDQLTSLSKLSNIGVFTNDIRDSLLNNEADLAVHSLKDLPIEDQKDTLIVSMLERADSRDILFLKKDIFENYNNKELRILTSSPRRVYNFSNFLESLIPFNPSNITFEDVRGNIPTRLEKLLNGDCQGLIVAKAAIDRLISYGNKDISAKIQSYLDDLLWMIIPLSLNPCAPGQGAIAIEVNSKRKDIIELVNKINHNETFSQVAKEREILQNYGGGCHQKIGVSIESKFFGQILTIKGQTEEGLEIEKREVVNQTTDWKNIPESNFFPSNLNKYKLFERKLINKNLKKINKLKNTNIYVSRENALPKNQNIELTNVVWTSGIKTWKKLAEKGYWVNGSSDSLGEDDPEIKCLSKNKKWVKLTHNMTQKNYFKSHKDPQNARIIPTYELKPVNMNEDLNEKTHFYWMSGSAFKLALKNYPKIINANHSCGPGNTLKTIKKYINKNNINVFLSYEDALKNITRPGDKK